MNVKKYLRYILKAWIPLMVAFGAIVFSMTAAVGASASAYVHVYPISDGSYFYYYNNSAAYSAIASMVIPSLLAACILPFFAFSHRYGKVRADCYLSLPAKDGQVTRIHVLTLGVFLVAVYLVAFLCGTFVAIFRQITQIAEANAFAAKNPQLGIETQLGSFGWYFLAWPLGAVAVAGFYFLNCFFVSQGNNVIQGLIAMVAGNIITNCLIPVACFTAVRYSLNSNWFLDFGVQRFFLMNGGIYMPVAFLEAVIGSMEARNPDMATLFCREWSVWVGLGLFLCYVAGSIFYLLCGKEPGGEMAGSDRPRNPFGIALPHIAAGIALTGMSAFMSAVGTGLDYLALTVILFLVSFVWSGGLYYVVISLYNHSFKLDKNNWIAFGSVLGGALLVYLTCLPIGIS